MDTDMLRDQSTSPADIPGLVAQARAAYQQNRIKECLALTKAALLVDPSNSAALEIQSAVRFDMQRDLSDARALIEESRSKPEAQKYRKAAEIILLKALYLDPDSEGAKTLLSSIRTDAPAASSQTPAAPAPPVVFSTPAAPPPPVAQVPQAPPVVQAPPPKPVPPVTPPVVFAPPVSYEPPTSYEEPVAPPVVFAPPVSHEKPDTYEPPSSYEPPASSFTATASSEPIASSNVMEPRLSSSEAIPFTVGTSYIEKPGYMKGGKKKSGSGLAVPLAIAAVVVIGAGLYLAKIKWGTNAAAATESDNTAKYQEQTSSQPKQTSSYTPTAGVATTSTTSSTTNSTPSKTTSASNTPPALPEPPASSASNASANNKADDKKATATVATTGSLAVSSAIAAEIYQGDKHLGSTPTTLQLPTGNQTLEYRHGDLRAVMTHTIKASTTTTALVVFDTVVQVTARPWATVSIEGSPRLSLGETPLSDVRLPVGSVLVFENPNFPSKSRRVGPDDKSIQMVFP